MKKMKKISEELIYLAYSISKEVYAKSKTRAEAAKELSLRGMIKYT